jgi:Glycosyl transferase family 2
MLVSASMIVRDEAHHLVACLDSLKPVVDEIVVVDTGSRDTTREIALAHGARLFDFTWRDDFSAARNHGLEAARGDWILYIDADERLRPYERAALAADLADPALIAATLRFHPRTGYTAYPEYRLFRRDERIRFSGAFHETMMPAFAPFLAAGRRIGHSALTIDHVGYDGDQSHKLDRNRRMLAIALRESPERIYLWWHLGTVERDLGHAEAAEAAWREGLKLAQQGRDVTSNAVLCVIELMKALSRRGEDCLPLLREGLALTPGNWLLRWHEARSLRDRGDIAAAEAIFHDLAAQDPDRMIDHAAYNRGIFGAGAWAELGYCAFLRQDYPASAACYAEAERCEPHSLEYRAKRVLAEARARATVGALP